MINPYLGERTLMRAFLDSILPPGIHPAPGEDLDNFLAGMSDNAQGVHDAVELLAHIRDPWTTPYLDELEREYGISPNTQLTDAQRRATLALVKYKRNRPSTIYNLQDALNRAGLGAGGYGLTVFANDPPIDPGLFSTGGARLAQVYMGGLFPVPAYMGYTVNGLPTGNWTAISYNGTSTYLAVGTNCAATSTDLLNWTPQSIPTGTWSSSAWNGTVFCIVSLDGQCVTTPTGVTYTSRAIPAGQWTAVTWVSFLSLFCAVSNGGANACATSPTGTTWTAQAGIPSGKWSGLASVDALSLIVAVADSSSGGASIATSANATAWTQRTDPVGGWSWSSVACNSSGLLVIVSSDGSPLNSGLYLSSSNGVTWISYRMPPGRWRTIISDPVTSLFVALSDGPSNYCATSPDASAWTRRTIPGGGWHALVRGSSLVAVGSGGSANVATSTDAVQWNGQGTPAMMGFFGGAGLWIVNGDAFTSSPNYIAMQNLTTSYMGYIDPLGIKSAYMGQYTTISTNQLVIAPPTDSWTWPLVFFIAASATRDSSGYISSMQTASIPANLWATLVEIVCRYKPTHTWALAMVDRN